jgi:hypothetical protein
MKDGWYPTVNAVGSARDGRLLASGDQRALKLWDITDPAHLATAATLVSHRPGFALRGVAFSPVRGAVCADGPGLCLAGL